MGVQSFDVAFKPDETNEYVLALGKGQLRRGRRYGVSCLLWGRQVAGAPRHALARACMHARCVDAVPSLVDCCPLRSVFSFSLVFVSFSLFFIPLVFVFLCAQGKTGPSDYYQNAANMQLGDDCSVIAVRGAGERSAHVHERGVEEVRGATTEICVDH